MNTFIRPKLFLVFVSASCAAISASFADPAWWLTRGARSPESPASDYGPVNQGQLKNMARAARDEMNANYPGGAGEPIDALVQSWETDTTQASDYSAVTIGQVKALAKVFYDRMIACGQATSYPWSGVTEEARDHAVANVGQVKQVFSFLISDDFDGDGIKNQDEIAHGLNPYVRESAPPPPTEPGYTDTDSDGISDDDETRFGLNPGTDEFGARATVYTMTLIGRLERVAPPGQLSQFVGYDKDSNITVIKLEPAP